jgi:hypothetical protein
MIKFDVWVELVCHKCSASRFGRHYYRDIRWDTLQMEAEAEGWTLIQNGPLRDWLCKSCSAKKVIVDAQEE